MSIDARIAHLHNLKLKHESNNNKIALKAVKKLLDDAISAKMNEKPINKARYNEE